MKKVLGILFIVILLTIGQNYYAGTSNVANASFNDDLMKLIKIDNHPNLFGSFFKLHNNDGKNKTPKNNEFMIKGTITASSSSSLTINNHVINIDSSVAGNVKIVGSIQTGTYAMVQGIIQNSNFYATKIIVDQRNKHENNKEDENVTPTITPTITITPTVTVTPTTTPTEAITPTLSPTPTGTQSANVEGSAKTNLGFNTQAVINMLRSLFIDLRFSLFKV